MPIDYSKYPANWKSEIRPAILERATHECENCHVKNKQLIIRGELDGVKCYQDMDGFIFEETTGKRIGEDYIGAVHPTNEPIQIVLTIAHLDHDVTNNDPANLKALCQKCHLNHDKELHTKNRKTTRNRNLGIQDLFEDCS